MPSVFRYSGQKYNESLLALGNIRVGTLHDFRRTEHKQGIVDVNEGKKRVSHHVPYLTEKDAESIHSKALSEFRAVDIQGATNVVIENLLMTQEFNHPDCFVHCTSFEYSSEVLKQFEGADSCVEISDVTGFYKRLTETLNAILPVHNFTLSHVKYMSRNEDWNGKNWGWHPALIKEPEFIKQVELRAIWYPKFTGNIAPMVINDTGLIKFCRKRDNPE